jgi:hypothetical protein
MRFKEIIESAGATCSGGIATVATPIGGMQTRNGGSLLTGKYTTDPTPNTPKRMKKGKSRAK